MKTEIYYTIPNSLKNIKAKCCLPHTPALWNIVYTAETHKVRQFSKLLK